MLHSVLIVDDTEFMRFVMREIMNDLPIGMIAEAGSRAEAVDLAKALEPDLAVVDFTDPDLGPVDVCSALQEARPGLGLVAVVHPDDEAGRREATATGAAAHVVKPFDPVEVTAILNSMLAAVPTT